MLQRISPQTVLSLWLMLATALGATYVQKYKFLDPAGQESSYPNEGGKFEMTCESSDAKEEVQLLEIALAAKAITVVAKGSGNASHQFELQPALIGRAFRCSSLKKNFDGGEFQLNHILCDPFPLIPKAQNCKPTQICVINNDKTATCNEMTDGLCFPVNSFDLMKTTFSSSLPNLRYACKESSNNDAQSHGLCHARVLKVTQITGTSSGSSLCSFFTEMRLNGRKVYQDDFVIESKDVSTWNVTFDTDFDYKKIVCKLAAQNDPKFAEIPDNGGKKTVLFASKTLKKLKEPTKLRLSCAFHTATKITKELFLYVLAIDMKTLIYKTSMTGKVKKSKESVSFECRCSVQPGFFCSLSWKEIPVIPDIPKDGAIKQDVDVKQHAEGAIVRNCFTAVFAIGYPASYNLVEVPGSRKTLSRTISKQELALPSGTVVSKTSSSGLNNTNSSIGAAAASKDSNDEGSSSVSPGVIVAIIAVLLTLIICAIVGTILYKRAKNRKPCQPAPVPNVEPSKQSKLITSQIAEDKPTKQLKSNAKTKSTPASQNDEFIRKLQS